MLKKNEQKIILAEMFWPCEKLDSKVILAQVSPSFHSCVACHSSYLAHCSRRSDLFRFYNDIGHWPNQQRYLIANLLYHQSSDVIFNQCYLSSKLLTENNYLVSKNSILVQSVFILDQINWLTVSTIFGYLERNESKILIKRKI